MRFLPALVLVAIVVAGCNDDRVVSPTAPPAAPRGLHSVTGDGAVTLAWLANTEGDVQGYRIYESGCSGGPQCPYDRTGATSATSFVVTGLANGTTHYFAVSAVDAGGRESALSYEDVFDTPRPAGTGLTLSNYLADSLHAGYDFSAFTVRSYSSLLTDIYFGAGGGQYLMFAPFTDTQIQDAGYATTLDAVDFAPNAGWSPTGTVELIPGHCYVVWTGDDHYAKFRVTSVAAAQVVVDWAYQTDPGNPELKARPEGGRARVPRHFTAWAKAGFTASR